VIFKVSEDIRFNLWAPFFKGDIARPTLQHFVMLALQQVAQMRDSASFLRRFDCGFLVK
jgi:hypothetical protein